MSDMTRDELGSAAAVHYRSRVEGQAAPAGQGAEIRRELVADGRAPEREPFSLRDYDSAMFGPFLGISNEGYGADTIADAALLSAKAVALAERAAPLTIGIGVDGEVLGGIGEVPIGPDEFAQIWTSCVGRTLMTTNVGARVNARTYRTPFTLTVDLDGASGIDDAKRALAVIYQPFATAPGGGRPLLAFVDAVGDQGKAAEGLAVLASYVATELATSPGQRLGLRVVLSGGSDDEAVALAALDLAQAAGIADLAIDGIARRAAERLISLPGLLNYLEDESVDRLLSEAARRGIAVRPFNHLDAATVARQIWSTLNTARGYGLHLGKYGLVSLTLEESDLVVGHIQRWLGDWSAAPVCYIDRAIVTHERVYVGDILAQGIREWLVMVARHNVQLVLIDTVDKAEGRKILKTDGVDAKGLLTLDEIADLDSLATSLGVRAMWAGGITRDQAYDFGRLGVFGVYITSAVSDRAPVSGIYVPDPGLDAEKRPNPSKIRDVKTLVEAGFLAGKLADLPAAAGLMARMAAADRDPQALAAVLPDAWRLWWSRA